jgi:hypothetical protein
VSETVAKELVIIVDGVKTPDYELLEEIYGSNLSNSIRECVERYKKENADWDLMILDQGHSIKSITFATSAWCRIYDVLVETKKIFEERLIGYHECEEVLNIMNRLKN